MKRAFWVVPVLGEPRKAFLLKHVFMKRTTPVNQSKISYNRSEEPIVISKVTMDLLLKEKNPSDLIALYSFYYYTAKWQNTTVLKAVIDYVSSGLNWNPDRVRKSKSILIKLGLVEEVIKRNDANKITGHYIKLNFIWYQKNHPSDFPEGGTNQRVENPEGNTLIANNINSLKTNNKNALLEKEKNKNNKKRKMEPFYENYSFFQNDFIDIWFDEFIPLKQKKKASTTERALTSQLNKIKEYSQNDYNTALSILEKSVNNGWSDFYPPDKSKTISPNTVGTRNTSSHRETYSNGKEIKN